MSDQIKHVRRFFRRLHRSLLNSVPNDGLKEVDLSKLQPTETPDQSPSMDWRTPNKPGDLPGHSKT
jgi:hypothetical protein